MRFSDETLMAYADGELDADTRRAVEAAMQSDPEIGQRIARHRALRSELGAAFGGVLDEQVPDRLIEAAKSSPAAAPDNVADLASARAARVQPAATRRRWSWPEWTSIAASALIGVLLGRAALNGPQADVLAATDRGVVAAGALAVALSEQVGGAGANGSAAGIGLSFRAKSGEYCRTFTLHEPAGIAGLACREADTWRVRALAESEADTDGDNYRMAATPLPPLILQAVEQTIEGDALDAQQEAAAREREWQP